MKRRNFILGATLGVGSLVHNYSFATEKQQSNPENNLKCFLDAIGAVSVFKLFSDETLLNSFQEKAKTFLATGYTQGSHLHFAANETIAILPLHLSPNKKDILDISVLFFRKNTDNEWKYCHTFSGFHLEALAQNLPHLTSLYNTGQLTRLIVPDIHRRHSKEADTIFTESGSLQLSVRIDDGTTTVNLVLKETDAVVMAKNFDSSHSLGFAVA